MADLFYTQQDISELCEQYEAREQGSWRQVHEALLDQGFDFRTRLNLVWAHNLVQEGILADA